MSRGTFVIPPGYIGLGDAFDRAFAALEDVEKLAKGLEQTVPITNSQNASAGLDPKAVHADEEARARVEFMLRSALSEGHLKAFTYGPDAVPWGEIPDRSQWQKMSFAFPGLETFIDPDFSPGPNIAGSPVLLEETKFKTWLKEKVAERTDPRLRTGRRGRPSAMPIIREQFAHRCQTGNVKEKLGEEARELLQWFKENHPLATPPEEHTIRNGLRDAHNEYKIKKSR
jgi:hypothetical protein